MKKIIFLIIFIGIALVSCEMVSSLEGLVVYSNSFESPKDTLNSNGVKIENFVNDGAPQSGFKSLKATGAEIQPPVIYYFKSPDKDVEYRLETWGKLLDSNYTAKLAIYMMKNNVISEVTNCKIDIKSNKWEYYKSEKVFDCPANSSFAICVFVGGFNKSASVLIDNLSLREIQ